MDPNLIRNAGTAGLGLAVLLAGLATWVWVGRRRFQRRNIAGIEEFSSYGAMILTAGFEKLMRIVAALAVIAGLKGAQFDRVLVVMDEEESDYNLYDYEKVLSEKQANADDRKAFETGEDNTWSRTLRLLYVCCTRAKRGLALAFFVANPAATAAHIVASGVFPKSSVITQDLLEIA
jgi:hypothetical protein